MRFPSIYLSFWHLRSATGVCDAPDPGLGIIIEAGLVHLPTVGRAKCWRVSLGSLPV
jgi:hypothetical protein